MKGASSVIGVPGKESSQASGGIASWLSNLEWNTIRYFVFGLAFSIVGVYQYFKWKNNKKSKEGLRKGQ